MDKVSIIVAYYNEEQYIVECLESLINQTYKNVEIILINDGSTDNSLKYAEKYAEKNDNVKIYSMKNSGVSVARNFGIEKATGDYILFVDGDDWIENYTVEFAVEKIKNSQSDILIWSYFQSLKNKEVKVPLLSKDNQTYQSNEEKQELYMRSIFARYNQENPDKTVQASAGTVMCKLYKMDIIRSNNIRFDAQLIRAEDVVFALEAFQKADKIQYFNESLYHYRMTEFSACSPKNYMADADTYYGLLLKRLSEFEDLFEDKEEFFKVFYARTIQVLLWHIKHKYFHKDNPNSIIKTRKAILHKLNLEPFKTAIMQVDEKLLSKQEKLMVSLFKKKLILSYYLFQKVIEKRNNFRKN